MGVRQVVIEGKLSMNSFRGVGVVGTQSGTTDDWKARLSVKGMNPFTEIPLGSKVRIEITMLE